MKTYNVTFDPPDEEQVYAIHVRRDRNSSDADVTMLPLVVDGWAVPVGGRRVPVSYFTVRNSFIRALSELGVDLRRQTAILENLDAGKSYDLQSTSLSDEVANKFGWRNGESGQGR
jgi:hypothetical protein